MAKPVLEDIFNQSRSLLGDDTQAGGQIFTDTVLQPHVAMAIRELFRVLRSVEDPFVLQDAYWLLPAEFTVLDPATMGLANFDLPEWIEWQLPGSPITPITGVTVGTYNGNPVATVTATNHGLTNGATVVTYGIGGFDYFNNPNGAWAVNVIDANTVTLNGCTATGTYSSGGSIMPLANQFTQMEPVDRIVNVSVTPGANPLNVYAWEGGVMRFYPASQPMLLRVVYRTSGIAPTNTAAMVPIDDSLDYISTRAAGTAAAAKGADQMAQALTELAVGPNGEADANGGILRQLVQTSIRNMQRQQMRMKEFRARRNRRDMLLF
jgi:hypothetical protein